MVADYVARVVESLYGLIGYTEFCLVISSVHQTGLVHIVNKPLRQRFISCLGWDFFLRSSHLCDSEDSDSLL